MAVFMAKRFEMLGLVRLCMVPRIRHGQTDQAKEKEA